jgi:hypothetical protein
MTAALFGSIPLPRRVRRALNKYDAHLYLPGPGGVLVHGFQPGNYVESTGVTPGSVDSLVGLGLDAAGSVGPELVKNGGFDADTNWGKGAGWSISGGVAVCAAATGDLTQSSVAASPVGKSYRVTMTVSLTSGSLSPQIGSSVVFIAASGTFSFVLRPTGADSTLYIPANNFTGSIDNISVRELTGIHASQATQGYKPYLRRGIVNLLTYSSELTNAAWTKDGVTASGSKLVESATTARHRVLNTSSVTLAADAPRTYAVVVEAAERTIVRVAENNLQGATFNLVTGMVTDVSSGVTASMAALSAGRKLLCISNTFANTACRTVVNLADSSGATTYAGDGTSGIYLYSAGLFQGALTAQQILDAGGIPLTTNAAASSANGKFWWQCDAIDDKLALTFPSGWESATIIDSRSTGQVTQSGQNIAGTYNIQTSTYGRIFCRLAPSAADLALLQKFANILSGYSA